MITLAHITDPHLPLAGVRLGELFSKRVLGWLSWRLNRFRLHRPEALARVVADVQARDPRVIAVTGDVLNISSAAEYAQGVNWLQRLADADGLAVVPGNHDFYVDRAATRHGKAQLSAPHGGPVPEWPWARATGNVALIGLDSTHAAPWGESSGKLGAAQLERLAHLLRDCRAKGLCRVVLLHHPPRPGMTKPGKALRDAGELEAVVREAGAELILYGHLHRWHHEVLETASGVAHVLSAPSASMRPDAGSAAAGWQMIAIGRRQGRWCYDITRRALAGDGETMRTIETLRLNSEQPA